MFSAALLINLIVVLHLCIFSLKINLNNKFELVESTQNDLLVFKLVSFVFIYL